MKVQCHKRTSEAKKRTEFAPGNGFWRDLRNGKIMWNIIYPERITGMHKERSPQPFKSRLHNSVPLPRHTACLHGGGGPQVGEVTRLGWVTPPVHIISHFNLIISAF